MTQKSKKAKPIRRKLSKPDLAICANALRLETKTAYNSRSSTVVVITELRNGNYLK
jgi:hypothetical protein